MRMIEKLSLYLPYKLRGIDLHGEEEEMLSLVNNEDSPHVMTKLKAMTCTRTILDHFKPVVRHPDDLTKEEIDYFYDVVLADGHWLEADIHNGFHGFYWEALPLIAVNHFCKLHVWLWPEDFKNGNVIRKQLTK